MKYARIFLPAFVLMPLHLQAQNVAIGSLTQGVQANADDVSQAFNGGSNPFQHTAQAHDNETLYNVQASATQDSNVSLSGNLLSVNVTGNLAASLTGAANGLETVGALSSTDLFFSTNAPLFFSVQATLSQLQTLPQPSYASDDETFASLAGLINGTYSNFLFLYGDANGTGSGPFSGTLSGTLQPGLYEYRVYSNLSGQGNGGISNNEFVDQSTLDTSFTVSQSPLSTPEPSATLPLILTAVGILVHRTRAASRRSLQKGVSITAR